MKYKVGTKKKAVMRRGKSQPDFNTDRGSKCMISAMNHGALNITMPKLMRGLRLNCCPLLLKGVLPEYVTGLKSFMRIGVSTKEVAARMPASIAHIASPSAQLSSLARNTPAQYCPRENPAVMPNQNTRFQKLSLFRRLFSQFTDVLLLSITAFSKAQIREIFKVIMLTSLMISSSNSATMAEKQEKLALLIKEAETKYDVPTGLLYSVAKVESTLNPWAVNINGESWQFITKEEAQDKIKTAINQGATNIDIGIMQINWRWHSKSFTSIEQLLEPETNINYAARLLALLYKQHKSWQQAVRMYHSKTPERHKNYSRQVVLAWLNR